jgi:hypothetical protein
MQAQQPPDETLMGSVGSAVLGGLQTLSARTTTALAAAAGSSAVLACQVRFHSMG